jgi:hypothetical protein
MALKLWRRRGSNQWSAAKQTEETRATTAAPDHRFDGGIAIRLYYVFLSLSGVVCFTCDRVFRGNCVSGDLVLYWSHHSRSLLLLLCLGQIVRGHLNHQVLDAATHLSIEHGFEKRSYADLGGLSS